MLFPYPLIPIFVSCHLYFISLFLYSLCYLVSSSLSILFIIYLCRLLHRSPSCVTFCFLYTKHVIFVGHVILCYLLFFMRHMSSLCLISSFPYTYMSSPSVISSPLYAARHLVLSPHLLPTLPLPVLVLGSSPLSFPILCFFFFFESLQRANHFIPVLTWVCRSHDHLSTFFGMFFYSW